MRKETVPSKVLTTGIVCVPKYESGEIILWSVESSVSSVKCVQTHGLCDDSDFVFLNAFVLQ